MAFKTDIEIARGAQKQPIQEVGAKLGIEAAIWRQAAVLMGLSGL